MQIFQQSDLIAIESSEGYSYNHCGLKTFESFSRDHEQGVLIANYFYSRFVSTWTGPLRMFLYPTFLIKGVFVYCTARTV